MSEDLAENLKVIFYPIKNNNKILGGAVIKLDMRRVSQSGMTLILPFKNQKYSKAIAYLHKVYLVCPEYSDIQNLYDGTIHKLAPIAQRLIGEGNVYEGIGKMDEARKKWNEALQIIPIESDELHQEAKRKLSGQ